jgi:hypothetical protein
MNDLVESEYKVHTELNFTIRDNKIRSIRLVVDLGGLIQKSK